MVVRRRHRYVGPNIGRLCLCPIFLKCLRLFCLLAEPPNLDAKGYDSINIWHALA